MNHAPHVRSEVEARFAKAFNDMASVIHQDNVKKGFWPENKSQRNFGEAIALIHSELSEALEGHRKNLADQHLPEFSSAEVELADAVIRIMDLAAGLGLKVSSALVEKLIYNRSRPYKHGKNY